MHRSDTPNSVGSDESSTKGRPVPRRRRSYVRAACNSCRTRKIACDGHRPNCRNCTKKGLTCNYVTLDAGETQTSALKRKVQELQEHLHEQIDFMNHLASAPDEIVLDLVRQMRSFGNPNVVVDEVESGLNKRYRPSIPQDRALIPSTPSSRFEIDFGLELSACFPNTYPTLHSSGIDISTISINALFATKPSIPPLAGNMIRDSSNGEMPTPPPDDVSESWEVGAVKTTAWPDERLKGLRIDFWTSIPITDEFAASVLSLYFKVDHPLHGFFDTDLFLRDLVQCRSEFCSPFLVATLMFYGCQLYSAVDRRASALCNAFFAQAEALWRAEGFIDSTNTVVALQLFSLGCLCNSRDEMSIQLCQEGRAMAERLSLIGVPPTMLMEDRFSALPDERQRATSHAAWGTYVWLTYHAFFYEDEGIHYPPLYPIPGLPVSDQFVIPEVQSVPSSTGSGSGSIFAAMCQLCVIAQDVATAFFSEPDVSIVERVPMVFIEAKYREMLAWAEQLPFELKRENEIRSDVLVMHIFYHVILLSTFRPYLNTSPENNLRSFSSSASTPQAVFSASIEQLKRLILITRLKYPHNISPILASAGHVHLCTTVPRNKTDPDWRFYFFLCVAYYQDMHVRYALCAQALQGILALAMVNDAISGAEAKKIMEGTKQRGRHHRMTEEGSALFMMDFDQALTDKNNAKACALASKFEELAIFDERRRASIPY